MASNPKWTSVAKEQVARAGKLHIASMASFDLAGAFVACANEGNSRTSKQLVALGRWFESNAHVGSETRDLHQRVLEKAQRSMVASYDQTRKGPRGYRPETRYSGGKLRSALNSSRMMTATASSMQFINTGMLNDEAIQWARLNFGAGAAGQSSPRSRMYPLRISNMVAATLGLDEGPRPAFFIPVGFFTGKGEFYLGYPEAITRRSEPDLRVIRQRKVTRGIRARHFLDRGVETIARETWPAYQRFIVDLVKDGQIRNLRPVNTVIHSARSTPWPTR